MAKIEGLRDRGAAKYFHGREKILLEFQKLLADSGKPKGGTTFLVQGPPGVGKTALLAKCWDEAEERGWNVRNLPLPALWNPHEMRKCLGIRPQKRTTGKTLEGEGKVEFLGAKVGGKVAKSSTVDTSVATPLELIQKGKKPLLLILDEAQHLGEDSRITGEYKDDVRYLLDQIHNGKLGRPVILLAGGLGLTEEAFVALGISRMAEDCKFDMEPLEKEEEIAVVEDWLKKAGGATEDVTHWIDTITTETYQWPRHVDSYARNAAQILKANGGRMTPELLRLVMEKGRANRMEYYQARLSPFIAEERRSLSGIMLASSKEGAIEQTGAVEQLSKEYGAEKAEELFFRAVRKGVLHFNTALGSYSVPIPSLREYIIRNFPPKEQSPDMGMER